MIEQLVHLLSARDSSNSAERQSSWNEHAREPVMETSRAQILEDHLVEKLYIGNFFSDSHPPSD